MPNLIKRPSKHQLRDSRRLIRQLTKEGWIFVRARGRDQRYSNPNKPENNLTVPHPVKDLPTGTLKSIYQQAGWTWS